MNLSKKWLLDYIDLNVDDKTFSDEMTLSGSKVEGYAKEGADLTNIVVGKLLSLEKHPDSDHFHRPPSRRRQAGDLPGERGR